MTSIEVLRVLITYLLTVAANIVSGEYDDTWADSTISRVYDILGEAK